MVPRAVRTARPGGHRPGFQLYLEPAMFVLVEMVVSIDDSGERVLLREELFRTNYLAVR